MTATVDDSTLLPVLISMHVTPELLEKRLKSLRMFSLLSSDEDLDYLIKMLEYMLEAAHVKIAENAIQVLERKQQIANSNKQVKIYENSLLPLPATNTYTWTDNSTHKHWSSDGKFADLVLDHLLKLE